MSGAWGLLRQLSPVKKLKAALLDGSGDAQRALQRQSDLYRLFLFTQLRQQLGGASGGQLAGYADELVAKAKALPLEELDAAVQSALRSQLAAAGRALHAALTAAGDGTPAARGFERAAAASGSGASSSSSSSSGQGGVEGGSGSRGGKGLSALGLGSSGDSGDSGGGGSGALLPQAAVSQLLRERLGYSLAVRPSSIQHQDAGLGLFLEGACPPGTLVALFPGLVYSKAHYRRMHNYPKVDKGNPYLVATYTGHVVDSLPWGRGWMAPQLPEAPQQQQQQQQQADAPAFLGSAASAAAASSRDSGGGSDSGSGSGSGGGGPPPPPQRKGYVRLMIEASDGPRRPPPATDWVVATTYEAASLELLEGRHPLALAQFANHATRSLPANAVVAPIRFRLQRRGGGGSSASGGSSSISVQSGSGEQQGGEKGDEPAWLRAYVPFVPYAQEPDHAHMLEEEVVGMGLVSVAPLADGDEVVFNYRLSPGLGRPSWYVPVDEVEEDRRWA